MLPRFPRSITRRARRACRPVSGALPRFELERVDRRHHRPREAGRRERPVQRRRREELQVVRREPVPVLAVRLQPEGVRVDGHDQDDAAGREQAAQHPQVVERHRQVGHHRPERHDVEAARGDLGHVGGRAEVRARAAGPLVGPLDRALRQVDAPGLEAALVGELHEQPRPAAEVEQPPAASVGEQIAEGVHGDGVALLARAGVAAGEETVVATLVQLAQPLRPDARMPVQEAARRAAHHVVAPAPVPPFGRQQRLHLLLAAQRAADHLLDVAQADPLRVLGAGQHRGARDPQPPARLVHGGCERQRIRAPAARRVPTCNAPPGGAGEPHPVTLRHLVVRGNPRCGGRQLSEPSRSQQ